MDVRLGGTRARDVRSSRAGLRAAAPAAALTVALLVLAGCAGTDDSGGKAATGTTIAVGTTTTTEAPVEAGEKIYVYVPEVGDCYDKRRIAAQGGTQTEIVLKLDCALPHEKEIFAIVEYPAPDPKTTDPKAREFPGDDALRRFGRLECPKQFRAYVGTGYEVSSLEIGFLMPAESNWPSNRKISCLLQAPNGARRSGTARGSAT